MEHFETLVLSSGGAKGFGMLGILHKLSIDFSKVKNFVGSSIGGIIVAMLCLDYLPIEIFFFLLDTLPIKSYKDKGKVFEKLQNLFKEVTFEDIFKNKGRVLVITSFNKKERQAIYYSKNSHPDKKIIEAINETSNIPFVSHTDEIFIDGCLCSPFPLKYAKDNFPSRTLGIYTLAANSNLLPIPNPYDDLKIILHQFYNLLMTYETFFAKEDDQIIRFDNLIPFEMFSVDFDMAEKLFIDGFNYATK